MSGRNDCGSSYYFCVAMSQEGKNASCSLHLGSHNVNGAFGSPCSFKLLSLVRLWCLNHLAVVMVQETHLTASTAGVCERTINEASWKMNHLGWRMWWSHHTENSAGVGMLIRQDMFGVGMLKHGKNKVGKFDADEVLLGRILQLAKPCV